MLSFLFFAGKTAVTNHSTVQQVISPVYRYYFPPHKPLLAERGEEKAEGLLDLSKK